MAAWLSDATARQVPLPRVEAELRANLALGLAGGAQVAVRRVVDGGATLFGRATAGMLRTEPRPGPHRALKDDSERRGARARGGGGGRRQKRRRRRQPQLRSGEEKCRTLRGARAAL